MEGVSGGRPAVCWRRGCPRGGGGVGGCVVRRGRRPGTCQDSRPWLAWLLSVIRSGSSGVGGGCASVGKYLEQIC